MSFLAVLHSYCRQTASFGILVTKGGFKKANQFGGFDISSQWTAMERIFVSA